MKQEFIHQSFSAERSGSMALVALYLEKAKARRVSESETRYGAVATGWKLPAVKCIKRSVAREGVAATFNQIRFGGG